MKILQTYAVVDLETTGTNPKKDRIIQFGCAFVQEGEIISTLAMDINPGCKIPKNIQALTGISQKQVQKAPFFEDVAPTIRQYLENTIFVAHNIQFDYSFLKHEFVRCGIKDFNVPGIDTVELAQIFLPTAPSFRLKDLTKSFALSHEHPHQADSDAFATAELLLKIMERIKSLPLPTLEMIVSLSKKCAMDTHHFLYECLQHLKKAHPPLAGELIDVEGIVLRCKQLPVMGERAYELTGYPRGKRAKEKRYPPSLTYRASQGRMMDVVYDFFTKTDEVPNLFLEAATGIGKTYAYLLPLSYLATRENPAIIATPSIILENQLMNDIGQLNQWSDPQIQATLVKSNRHYLNLARFKASLAEKGLPRQVRLWQMMILVWLTKTTTGDLDELRLNQRKQPFWQEVSHRGESSLDPHNAFYPHDFLRHLHSRIKSSNFLIVNHAFLVEEDHRSEFALPPSDYLVIDEAHRFPDIASKAGTARFRFSEWEHLASQLRERFEIEEGLSLEGTPELLLFERIFFSIEEEVEALQEWLASFVPRDRQTFLLEQGKLPADFAKLLLKLKAHLADFLTMDAEFFQEEQTLEHERLLQLIDLLQILANLETGWIFWAARQNDEIAFVANEADQADLPQAKWFERYPRVLFTGGTLKASRKDFLPEELGLTDYRFKVFKSPFDYSKQSVLVVPETDLDFSADSGALAYQLSGILLKFLLKTDQPTLILFTSHELLQKVFHHLNLKLMEAGRESFAQGLSGNQEKILKRFANSGNGVLFGADVFWEGIDLPEELLSFLIVTRLPFENPQRPLVKARYQRIQARGKNPFYYDSLPRAAFRLRQGLGRLIRSEDDYGAMLVLDPRLITASYAGQLAKAFPKELPIYRESLSASIETVATFFQEKAASASPNEDLSAIIKNGENTGGVQ